MVVSKGVYSAGRPLQTYKVYYYNAIGMLCTMLAVGKYGVCKASDEVREQGGKPLKAKVV